MKKILALLILSVVGVTTYAGDGGAASMKYINSDHREYLESVEKGMIGDALWKSLTTIQLTTSDYTAGGDQIYGLRIQVVDSTGKRARWLTTSIANFSLSTNGPSGVLTATLPSSTLSFIGGSAGVKINATGPFSIGDQIRVTAPALVIGNVSSAAKTWILSFTQ